MNEMDEQRVYSSSLNAIRATHSSNLEERSGLKPSSNRESWSIRACENYAIPCEFGCQFQFLLVSPDCSLPRLSWFTLWNLTQQRVGNAARKLAHLRLPLYAVFNNKSLLGSGIVVRLRVGSNLFHELCDLPYSSDIRVGQDWIRFFSQTKLGKIREMGATVEIRN